MPARSGQVIIVKAHEVDTREKLDGLVLLIRNPYDAIVSDFNRKYTKGNHTGLVPVQRFKTKGKKFGINSFFATCYQNPLIIHPARTKK